MREHRGVLIHHEPERTGRAGRSEVAFEPIQVPALGQMPRSEQRAEVGRPDVERIAADALLTWRNCKPWCPLVVAFAEQYLVITEHRHERGTRKQGLHLIEPRIDR